MKKEKTYKRLWRREIRHRRFLRFVIVFTIALLIATGVYADRVLSLYESLQPKYLVEQALTDYRIDEMLQQRDDLNDAQKEKVAEAYQAFADKKTLSYRLDPSAVGDEKRYLITCGGTPVSTLSLKKAGTADYTFFHFEKYELSEQKLSDSILKLAQTTYTLEVPADARILMNGEPLPEGSATSQVRTSPLNAHLPTPCETLDTRVYSVKCVEGAEFTVNRADGQAYACTREGLTVRVDPFTALESGELFDRSVLITEKMAAFFTLLDKNLYHLNPYVQRGSVAYQNLEQYLDAVSNITAAKATMENPTCTVFYPAEGEAIVHITADYAYTARNNLTTDPTKNTFDEKLDYTLFLHKDDGADWMVYDFIVK